MPIKDYRDLEVWQRVRKLTESVWRLKRTFPKEEMFGMTSQIRRAAVSIAVNIAEGWGRRYTAEFIQFLRKANGSRLELETHLLICIDVGLCQEAQIQPLLEETTILGKQLVSLERSLARKK